MIHTRFHEERNQEHFVRIYASFTIYFEQKKLESFIVFG